MEEVIQLKENKEKTKITLDVAKTKLLPAPLTPGQKRQQLIERVAEEVLPGMWSIENTTKGQVRGANWGGYIRYGGCIGEPCGECNYCDDDYPEDCENVELNENSSKSLIIKFDKNTIKNQEGQSHYIEDFYIAIVFDNEFSNTIFEYPMAFRSTCTTKEFANGFAHSHAHPRDYNNVDDYFQWRSLCLGGTTALTDLNYSLKEGEITEKVIHELLLMLNLFAGWESRDGGPHQYFSNLKYPSTRSSSNLQPLFTANLNGGSILSTYLRKIYKNTLQILFESETIEAPELVGNINNLGISNTNNSISIALKEGLITTYLTAYEDSDIDSSTLPSIFNNIFKYEGKDFFVGGSHPVYNLDYYTNVVKEHSGRDLSEYITFKSEPIKTKIVLDTDGLSDIKEITKENLQVCEIDDSFTKHFVQIYISELIKFKIKKLL